MPVVKDKMEIASVLRRANEQIGRFRNNQPQQFPITAKFGDGARQGDFYFTYIDHDPNLTPLLYREEQPEWPRQLVDGTSKGSRHILSYATKLWLPVKPDSRELYEDLAAQWNIAGANKIDFLKLRHMIRTAEQDDMTNRRETWMKLPSNERGSWSGWADNAPMSVENAEGVLAFSGPIFYISEADMARRPCLTHPEHADWYFIPGCYRTTYQRTVSKENRIVRVID